MKTMNENFAQFLENEFIALREINGVPIIKDNYEKMFDSWLSSLDNEELINFADKAIEKNIIETQEKMMEVMTAQNNMLLEIQGKILQATNGIFPRKN